jgi:hypothetical protein
MTFLVATFKIELLGQPRKVTSKVVIGNTGAAAPESNGRRPFTHVTVKMDDEGKRKRRLRRSIGRPNPMGYIDKVE